MRLSNHYTHKGNDKRNFEINSDKIQRILDLKISEIILRLHYAHYVYYKYYHYKKILQFTILSDIWL